ncbi:MAG: hypothetical protein HYU71_15235 [Bacteroidetes bacterium]|nr:hypothetical protein [Bacteroidota bacterium]
MSILKKTILFLFICFGLLCATIAEAQPTGFVYLQTENNTTYQVRWNGNTYQSSSTGHLVIPQMPAGEHLLQIDFPSSLGNGYAFTIRLADKPRAFFLRQAVNSRWSLVDMIDLSQLAGKEILPSPNNQLVFEELIPAQPEKKMAEPPAQKGPGLPVAKKDTRETAVVRKPLREKVQDIKKIFDRGSVTGIDQVYVIITGNRSDTIALFIPVLQQPDRQMAAAAGRVEKTGRGSAFVSGQWFTKPEITF